MANNPEIEGLRDRANLLRQRVQALELEEPIIANGVDMTDQQIRENLDLISSLEAQISALESQREQDQA